jgi:hypothetical protein
LGGQDLFSQVSLSICSMTDLWRLSNDKHAARGTLDDVGGHLFCENPPEYSSSGRSSDYQQIVITLKCFTHYLIRINTLSDFKLGFQSLIGQVLSAPT